MLRLHLIAGTMWTVSALCLCCQGECAEEGEFLVLPENTTTLTILRGGEPYLDIEFVGWGPNWSWMGFQGDIQERGDATQLISTARVGSSGADIKLSADLEKTGPRQVRMQIDLRTNQDTPLTHIVASLSMADRRFSQGTIRANLSDGSTREVGLPLDKKGLGDAVRQFTLVDMEGATTRVTLEPARDIPSDGAARIVLAASQLRADTPVRTSITIDLPADVTYYASGGKVPADPGLDDWYEFHPHDDPLAPSEIGMQDWLDKPAGKHGRIAREEDALIYNGKPIKLWGLNLCYGTCCAGEGAGRQAGRVLSQVRHQLRAAAQVRRRPGLGRHPVEGKLRRVRPGGPRPHGLPGREVQGGGHLRAALGPFRRLKLGPADKQYVPYLEEFGKFTRRRTASRRRTAPSTTRPNCRTCRSARWSTCSSTRTPTRA